MSGKKRQARVRVAVVIDANGVYTAAGESGATDETMSRWAWEHAESMELNTARLVWIEADVPLMPAVYEATAKEEDEQ